jgi:uncharacterized protein (TIGR02996 family)
MDDHAALVAAVVDRPDDDTPRLVLADWLDDHGHADRAAFVRAQVELARTPEWEPFAVACRHRTPEWSDAGALFRDTLPPFPAGWAVEWAEPPFRRGLGWRVRIGSLLAWEEVAPELVRAAPIGALHLRAAATLDDWRRFAAGPGLDRIREVHLETASPVEPVRSLAATGVLARLTGLHFHAATSPGLDLIVEDVLAGPAAAGLRELSFRVGSPASMYDLMDVLAGHSGRFDRLALRVMMLSPDPLRRWAAAGGLRGLRSLDLTENYGLGNAGARALAEAMAGGTWAGEVLVLEWVGMAEEGAKALAGSPGLASVRLLDLSRNSFARPGAARALAASPHLAGLRALRLRRCGLGDLGVRRLVRGTFWPNLVELDLRGNPVSDPGAKALLAAPVPPDLTALVLTGRHLSGPTRAALARHFGPRVVFETDE